MLNRLIQSLKSFTAPFSTQYRYCCWAQDFPSLACAPLFRFLGLKAFIRPHFWFQSFSGAYHLALNKSWRLYSPPNWMSQARTSYSFNGSMFQRGIGEGCLCSTLLDCSNWLLLIGLGWHSKKQSWRKVGWKLHVSFLFYPIIL